MSQQNITSQALPKFSAKSAFSKDLSKQSKQWFQEASMKQKASHWQWLRGGTFFSVGCIAYFYLVSIQPSWTSSILLLTLLGICCYSMLMIFGHDASHNACSQSKLTNKILLFFSFSTDIDSYASNIIRLSPHQPWRFYHRFQPLYAPLFMLCGVIAYAWSKDFSIFLKNRSSTSKKKYSLTQFLFTKLFHLTLFILLPILVFNISIFYTFLAYFYLTAIISTVFWVLVVGTHVSSHAAFPTPNSSTNRLDQDWATLQVDTTVDWSPKSRLANWLTGGSNSHLAHHLFPSVSHVHGAYLSEKIEALINKHDLNYRVVPFHQVFLGSLTLIFHLSKKP